MRTITVPCPTCGAAAGEPCRYIRHKKNRGVNEGKITYRRSRLPHAKRCS